MKPQIIVFVFLTVMLLFSCKKEELVLDRFLDINFAGQVVKIESLGEYSETDAVQILGMLNPSSPIQTSCGFTMYRISYKTQNFDGSEVIVSGLLALPKTHKMKGIVSWQHGTNT